MGEITKLVELYVDKEVLPKKTYEIAQALQNNIKKESPYWHGDLKRSIRADTRITGKTGIVTGYYDEGIAPHGIFVLVGVRGKAKVKPNDFLGKGLLDTIAMYG